MSNEQLLALVEDYDNGKLHPDQLAQAIRALATQSPQADKARGEDRPFGWWLTDSNGVGRFTRQSDTVQDYATTSGYNATPLYATPQPQGDVSLEAGVDAAVAATGHINLNSMTQCADSWLAVVDVLSEVSPNWSARKGTGRECAISAIRELATSQVSGGGEDLEAHARGLLDTSLRNLGLHADAYFVGCGGELDQNDKAAINAIVAALSATHTQARPDGGGDSCRGPGICELCSRAAGCCFKGERCGRADCPAPLPNSFRKPAPCPSARPQIHPAQADVARLVEAASVVAAAQDGAFSSEWDELDKAVAPFTTDKQRGDSRGGEAKEV